MMKKFIVILIMGAFCGGCYIPYPSSGRRTFQPYERWEKVCTEKVNKKGEKETHCRWVRSR